MAQEGPSGLASPLGLLSRADLGTLQHLAPPLVQEVRSDPAHPSLLSRLLDQGSHHVHQPQAVPVYPSLHPSRGPQGLQVTQRGPQTNLGGQAALEDPVDQEDLS